MPKKEPHAVTIGNMERQIDNLLHKIQDLNEEIRVVRRDRDDWLAQVTKIEEMLNSERRQLEMERSFRKADVDRLTEAQAHIAKLESQIEGYRMAIKDIHGK